MGNPTPGLFAAIQRSFFCDGGSLFLSLPFEFCVLGGSFFWNGIALNFGKKDDWLSAKYLVAFFQLATVQSRIISLHGR